MIIVSAPLGGRRMVSGDLAGMRASGESWEKMKQTQLYQASTRTQSSLAPKMAGSLQKTGCHVQEQL